MRRTRQVHTSLLPRSATSSLAATLLLLPRAGALPSRNAKAANTTTITTSLFTANPLLMRPQALARIGAWRRGMSQQFPGAGIPPCWTEQKWAHALVRTPSSRRRHCPCFRQHPKLVTRSATVVARSLAYICPAPPFSEHNPAHRVGRGLRQAAQSGRGDVEALNRPRLDLQQRRRAGG